MKIKNPATGDIIIELKADTAETLKNKFNALKEGQKSWSALSVGERLECIEKFGALVQQHKNELAAILTEETGKPIQQSLNEITGAHNRIDHLCKYAERWLSEEVLVDSGNTREKIAYEPLGVIVNISAWNFPYNVGYNVFLYALAGGNSVMYKPSEYAVLTGKQFEKYLHRAGVPENVFQCVIGDGRLGQLLLEEDFDGYFFTGSYATGKHIAETVAHKLVPVQLELGGKDPLYVTDDVPDIKQAAINAAEGAFYNNGQSCCAVERIYVAERIYDEFIDAFVEEVNAYKVGNPVDPDTFIGPLTREQQLGFLSDQVADALNKGAFLKAGGQSVEEKGYYFRPTVLVNCDHRMKVMTEESFGPVIGIQKVASDDEAVSLMKDTPYGLTAAVFSSDEQRALNLLRKMDTGTVYWNCCDRVSPNVPWSGRKNSGLGSTLSFKGIRAFVQPKSYHLRNW
ncbi:aldehyde dehydrogenase family protein [Sinomicrobium weinanense]|uniref:Aldehyde dehydrogenase family protein n=1 Tax=Sinomicrobium weinanense TaxID=2842200 RepID=A0A926Q398_9FLAO|nr:aldehyde dehydrogenase family protein [Sinomicrobium weinanense]MBC9797348.1 aldehyde dehydrogenase family protein [Sinomicrobium weinanense]MBU3124528.1 aldehyde dehydrogenase family protein [Sinomicrobium weinanense]